MEKMNLSGIRVIEFTHWVAGPLAGQILGEWGADVIHVERVGTGDVTRENGPFYKGQSLYYRAFNRDKRSVTLDVSRPDGRETLFRLIEQSDVFLTNYTAHFLEKYGITYEALKARKSDLIACFLSGFGLTGRYREKKGFDMTMQAMSGLMALTGEPDGSPTKIGTIMGDYIGGYQAVIGILTALQGRNRTGQGQLIDVAITDSLIAGLEWRITECRLTGSTAGRTGNRRPTVAPCNLYRTTDGYIYIAASSQGLFERLARLIGDPRLQDEKFSSNKLRVANVEELDQIVQEWVGQYSKAEADEILEKAEIPSGLLQTPEDLAGDTYVDEKDLVVKVKDAALGEEIPLMGSPIRMSWGYRKAHIAPPLLGQHNREVYEELLGWDEAEQECRRRAGVIG